MNAVIKPSTASPDLPAEWGDLAAAAKVAEAPLGPLWKKFIKTKFFVSIQRSPDDDPKNYLLYVARSADSRSATLTISEVRDRLDAEQGDGIIALSGADILCRLEDRAGIQVALAEGAYRISGKRADWLRSGIKMTKDRIAIRKRLLAALPAAPLPVLSVSSSKEPGPAPEVEEDVPASPPIFQSLYFKPIGGAVAAIGVVTAVFMSIGPAPEAPKVATPHEAPVLAPAAPPPPRTASAPAELSIPFSPADNSFKVFLPGMAEEVELSPDQVSVLGERRMHQYRLSFEGRLYTMEAIDYMANPPYDPMAEMDVIQQTIVGAEGNLIRAKPISLRGNTGREVRVRLPDGGERAARFAFVGSKYCQVMVTVPAGAAAHIDTFLDSFQLN